MSGLAATHYLKPKRGTSAASSSENEFHKARSLNLNINDDEILESPDTDALIKALHELKIDQFAILDRGDEYYIQTYYNDDETFALEYREGDYEKHFRAEPEPTNIQEVVEAFLGYFDGGSQWRERHEWERVEFDA